MSARRVDRAVGCAEGRRLTVGGRDEGGRDEDKNMISCGADHTFARPKRGRKVKKVVKLSEAMSDSWNALKRDTDLRNDSDAC